nr:hypothetical protein B0A51_15213 [Rachicladosporium sp. CCFEE 5018]
MCAVNESKFDKLTVTWTSLELSEPEGEFPPYFCHPEERNVAAYVGEKCRAQKIVEAAGKSKWKWQWLEADEHGCYAGIQSKRVAEQANQELLEADDRELDAEVEDLEAELDATLEADLAELDATLDADLAELEATLDADFAERDAELEATLAADEAELETSRAAALAALTGFSPFLLAEELALDADLEATDARLEAELEATDAAELTLEAAELRLAFASAEPRPTWFSA